MCVVPEEARGGHQSPLELEFHMIVSHQVGAGNQTWVPWKNTVLLIPLNHLSSRPCFDFLKESFI